MLPTDPISFRLSGVPPVSHAPGEPVQIAHRPHSNFACVRLRPPACALLVLLACAIASAPALALAQGGNDDSATSRLGVTGIGALGAHVGVISMERSIHGVEGGLLMDLGWMHTRRLRLQGEVEYLGARYSEFVEVDDRTYRSPISDFSVAVTAIYALRTGSARTVPYLSAGIGVHALSSAFGTAVIDRRYNANPFGSLVGIGLRQWRGDGGRSGLFIEARRVIAENVDRWSLRIGALAFYRDLVRPATR